MANLSVEFCGIPFKNPLVLASATPTQSGLNMVKGAQAGAAGLVPKTLCSDMSICASPHDGMRYFVYKHNGSPIGMLNHEMYSMKELDEWLKEDLPAARKTGAVMQISIAAMPTHAKTAQLAKIVAQSGYADIIELNPSCPMPSDYMPLRQHNAFGDQLKAARDATDLPITVKLSPNTYDMVESAALCKELGANGLTIGNTITAFAGVDIETGRPIQNCYGGYSGHAIRPVIMKHLSDVARHVDLPISATGGVNSYKEVVEYIMLGASTVQICTAVMFHGFEVISAILNDLNAWLDKKGYASVSDIKGQALKDIVDFEIAAKNPVKYAKIDQAKCSKCGACEKTCFYQAIEKHQVDQQKCGSCGLCAQLCPKKAITLG